MKPGDEVEVGDEGSLSTSFLRLTPSEYFLPMFGR